MMQSLLVVKGDREELPPCSGRRGGPRLLHIR